MEFMAFYNFCLIATKTILKPGKRLKDSKNGLRFEIGWVKVGFYTLLTERHMGLFDLKIHEAADNFYDICLIATKTIL